MGTVTVGGWMVYALAIGALTAASAWLAERGLARLRLPTRWIWVAALLLSIALPVSGSLSARTEFPSSDAVTTVGADDAFEVGAPREGGHEGRRPLTALSRLVARGAAGLERGLAAGATLLSGAAVGSWLAYAWGAASLALAFLLVASSLRTSRVMRAWPRELLLGRAVRVAPRLGPATVGLARPEIVVPSWARALPSAELELVLAHEEEHVRTRDPLLLAVGLAAAVACPWNPLLWWQHRRLRDAVEVDCDRRVVRRGAPSTDYGDLLVKLGSRGAARILTVPTMTGSRSLLRRRLTAMKRTKLRDALPRAFAALAASLALGAIACGTEPPVANPEPGGVDAQAAQLARNELVADIWVEPDGSVYVNDEAFSMQEVSEVVGALDEASGGSLVIAIAAAPGVPYHVMDALQHELQSSGTTRVMFAESATRPGPTPPGDVADVADGLPLVLPTSAMSVPVSGRNLLHLVVQPSGSVEVRRGRDPRIERIRPAEVEAVWRREVAANPNLIAAVKTHPEASYSDMRSVLEALRAADAQRISLQALAN